MMTSLYKGHLKKEGNKDERVPFILIFSLVGSHQLLALEKLTQMSYLPHTSNSKHNQLHQRPIDHPRIGIFTRISEVSLPLSLINLLSSDHLDFIVNGAYSDSEI